MIRNYSLFCFFGILAVFTTPTYANESIINGLKSLPHQFLYQVLIHFHDQNFECGGGIIGDQFILTAAHCLYKDDGQIDKGQISVLAGTHDRHRTHSPAVIAHVMKFYLLKNFHPGREYPSDDIAVLKLRAALGLMQNQYLKKLELPNRHQKYTGKKVMIAGFGWDWMHRKEGAEEEVNGGQVDSILRYAVADVLRPGQHGYPNEQIPDKLIWARVEQHANQPRGVCSGDSGGPLVYGTTIIGVLSSGPVNCWENDIAAAYIEVSEYLEFIDNAIHDRHRDHMIIVETHH